MTEYLYRLPVSMLVHAPNEYALTCSAMQPPHIMSIGKESCGQSYKAALGRVVLGTIC